eukprot:CAMPEP_0170135654 /NCGR_PEP_ID=MMETSP0033_2-20121228/2589_1 /TAXON_ID=195969 /ORGANISM="Dolichomastix tenuilepis, Strain CCMP3274" /LENGTH=188 /DNA_ID=CAMNT_0010371257 /DNA_START=104 /DNA_END=666 /DNA_ORIENTATION=+
MSTPAPSPNGSVKDMSGSAPVARSMYGPFQPFPLFSVAAYQGNSGTTVSESASQSSSPAAPLAKSSVRRRQRVSPKTAAEHTSAASASAPSAAGALESYARRFTTPHKQPPRVAISSPFECTGGRAPPSGAAAANAAAIEATRARTASALASSAASAPPSARCSSSASASASAARGAHSHPVVCDGAS